jgi:hypothetical protein
MPKLRKDDTADIDVRALEDAETGEGFDSYDGEVPPAGTLLSGYVRKMWWTRTAVKPDGSGEDPMITVLWIAAENEGKEAKYNGLPVWERLVLVPQVKFRWGPFFAVYDISMADVKTKTYVAEEDDNQGAPIEKIGTFEPGEANDEAWARIITERHRYNDEWSARPKKWLPYDDENGSGPAEDDDDEGPEDEADDIEPDEADEDETDEDETEEEAPARGRGSRAASKAPAKAPARTATAARGRKPAAATRAPSGRSSAKASTAPAARSRGRRSGPADDDDEPPF